MSTEIRIPKLAVSMEGGQLTEWCVADGTAVSQGTLIFLLETEKSVVEIEAPSAGTLRILAPAGEYYEIDALVGEIS